MDFYVGVVGDWESYTGDVPWYEPTGYVELCHCPYFTYNVFIRAFAACLDVSVEVCLGCTLDLAYKDAWRAVYRSERYRGYL